jgi:circadian clock protein KaiB
MTKLKIPQISSALRVRLYVAGEAPNSSIARANLASALADAALHIEIIDVLSDCQRALSDGIVVTPTLLRLTPFPCETMIGTLADVASLRRFLRLPT